MLMLNINPFKVIMKEIISITKSTNPITLRGKFPLNLPRDLSLNLLKSKMII